MAERCEKEGIINIDRAQKLTRLTGDPGKGIC